MENFKGLTAAQVEKSRQENGTNKLPEKKLKSGFQFFIETFQDKLNLILLGMMILFAVLAVTGQGSISEPIGIAVVLIAIAAINTSTGLKSQKSAKELKDRTSTHYVNVIRDGNVQHINSNDIVVGDVVKLQSGDAIYADGYLVEGKISVNNSVLNGESKECKKTPIDDFKPQKRAKITGDDYVDQNSLFAGTTIVDGEGTMVVTEVGVNTVNGKTITSIDDIEQQKTSLQIQLDDLADNINKFGYIAAIIIAIALLATEVYKVGGFGNFAAQGVASVLSRVLAIAITALTIIVAAVPEGLPLIISLITAQNAKVMIKHNVLAKNTNKIPEAGNIQLLCTDKTGTLTVGKLVVVKQVDLNGNDIKTEENICLNTDAMFDDKGEVVGGNATEKALLGTISKDKFEKINSLYKVIDKKGFNSAYKFSAVRTTEPGNTLGVTYYKGAPERLINAAKYQGEEGEKQEPINKEKALKMVEDFANKAMRVIATGYSREPIPTDGLPDDLTITSLIAIRDDVRPEVPAAVAKVQRAGIQVMMITGDVLPTARAIARDTGIIKSADDIAMTASDFEKLSDDEAKRELPHIKVIARATPDTKIRIVRLAQELKLCVGMSGDGTNDSPALKAADVGFSMGSGTDVCKDAGDIIITDDNFVSISDAILLGRTFMHNVLKFLKFQLPINVGLVILSILYPILFGVEAIAAVQILVINIVMDSLNSLSFGGEPAKDEYMLEKPIPKGSPLIGKDTFAQIATSTTGLIALFAITWIPSVRAFFGSETTYQTARFALLIIAATINGFNIREDSFKLFKGLSKNTMFIKIAALIFIGTFLLAQFGGSIMHCTGLSAAQWVVIFALSLLMIPIDFVRKTILRSKEATNGISQKSVQA